MRATLALLLPLLVVFGLTAWGAALVVEQTGRAWFDRDTRLRAQLVVAGARDGIVTEARQGDTPGLRRLLSRLASDERVMGAALCSPDRKEIAATPQYPAGFGCRVVRARGPQKDPPESPWAFEAPHLGGRVHVTAVPIDEDGSALGYLVMAHDMSWVERREEQTRRFLAIAFGIVAIAAAVATMLAARFSWNRWTDEVRKLLAVPFLFGGRDGDARPRARREFQPLLSDVRSLVAELAAEQGEGHAGFWSPERLRDVLARNLPGSDVLVVANREPYIHDRNADGSIRVHHPASGLVTALEPVVQACGGTWIAHGSGAADRDVVDARARVRVPPDDPTYTLRRVWLTEEDEQGYYYGFANEGLWPLSHVVHTRPVFRAEDLARYRSVNRKFAEAVREEARGPDPVVLVQDYHYALLPKMIRELLPRATTITFWHIPWPNGERFGICPFAPEILEGLLGSSIVGFHTQAHCNNFLESVDRMLEARIDRERQSVILNGQETLVRAYPISIEWPSHWAAKAPPAALCRESVRAELGLAPDALLGVGIDRLDYTKGIEERLLAVERLLERFPQFRGRFTFAQLAAPSRTRIPRYQELNRSVDELAARVNERFGKGAYRPIVLLREHHEPPTVFRYYRAADLCYVSSLHDGMNLVAKEFVAARDDEAGVLVLSRFTGAAREMGEALLVNPYDLEEASAALAAALSMPREEQRARMHALRAFVAEFNVYRWAGRMLVDAGRLRKRDRVSDRLTMPIRSLSPGDRRPLGS